MSRAPISRIAVAPDPPASGLSLFVTEDDGALFPTPPFTYLAWPAGQLPADDNSEEGTVTFLYGDEVTLLRPDPIELRTGLMFACLSQTPAWDLEDEVVLVSSIDGIPPYRLDIRRPNGALETQDDLDSAASSAPVPLDASGIWWYRFSDGEGLVEEQDLFVRHSQVL